MGIYRELSTNRSETSFFNKRSTIVDSHSAINFPKTLTGNSISLLGIQIGKRRYNQHLLNVNYQSKRTYDITFNSELKVLHSKRPWYGSRFFLSGF